MSEQEIERMSSSESELSLGDPNEMFDGDECIIKKEVDNWAEEVEDRDKKREEKQMSKTDAPHWKSFISPKMVSIDDRSIVHLAEGNPWKTDPGKLLETYSPKDTRETKKPEQQQRVQIMRMGNFNLTKENFPKMGEQKAINNVDSSLNRETDYDRNSRPRMKIVKHDYTRDYVPARKSEQSHWTNSLNSRRERVRELNTLSYSARRRLKRRDKKQLLEHENELYNKRIANANVDDGWTVVTKGKQKVPSLPPERETQPVPEPVPEPVIVPAEITEDEENEVLEIIPKKKKSKKRKVSIDVHEQEVTKYSRIVRYYQMGMSILVMLFLISLSVRI